MRETANPSLSPVPQASRHSHRRWTAESGDHDLESGQRGPGTVNFANASALDTSATFSAVGNYLLQLEATDGQFTSVDYVNITVNPVTATLTAVADTYIDGGSTTTNYGTSASLSVSGKPDDAALLKWDLSSIPAGSTLQSAKLSLNVTGTSTNTYEIYELKRSWSESQATWKKANSATNWQTAGAVGALDRGTTVLGTVTASATGILNVALNAAGLAVVQGWVNNPASNFGFVLQDYANTNKDDLVFSSKEATVAANRPQLSLVYNPPALPMSLTALAGSSLNTATTSADKPPALKKNSTAPAKEQAFADLAAPAQSSRATTLSPVVSTRPKDADPENDFDSAPAFDLALESALTISL